MITLCNFEAAHLQKTFEWISDEEIRRFFLFRRTITWADHLKWFENYKTDATQQIFAIRAGDVHCGNCGYKFISQQDRKAELWIYIGEKNMQGKGIAKAAMQQLIQYGFEKLNLNKIYLHVAEFNTRALEMYKKLQFQTEGFFPSEFRLNEKLVSVFRLYLLKNQDKI